jgi:hypothetical protein
VSLVDPATSNWDGFKFDKVSGIVLENNPGNYFTFEYEYNDVSTFVHGFAFVPEGQNVQPFNLINFIGSSWWETNSVTNILTHTLTENTKYYVKYEVPDVLGDLLVSVYTDSAYTNLYDDGISGPVYRKSQRLAINKFVSYTDVTRDAVFNNTDSNVPWLLQISVSNYDTKNNNHVIIGNFSTHDMTISSATNVLVPPTNDPA